MKYRTATALALSLALAGLLGTLALPERRGGAGTAPASSAAPRANSSEEAAFAALVDGRNPLDPTEHERLLGELRAQGPLALARLLERLVAEHDSERARLVALECLGGCASAGEPTALVRLATPAGGPPSETLRAGLRSAVVRTLVRDPRAPAGLVPAWRAAGSELRSDLLEAVAERGDPAGLEFLAWVATFESGPFDRALADACLGLAPRARRPDERAALERLCLLLDSPDPACVQTISIALSRARVDAAVPRWIALLDSESRGIRERARRSLEELSGLALGPLGGRWLAWYETECAWFEDEAPRLFAELECADDARVLAALRALSARRLHRDELALAVAGLLGNAAADVRLQACRTLESFGSPLVVPALVETLEDEDETVARGAWSALRTLTGIDLPLDQTLWRAHGATL